MSIGEDSCIGNPYEVVVDSCGKGFYTRRCFHGSGAEPGFWGRTMLFDERPKERREDLYDRERELEEIKGNIGRPLIILTGIRRIGKTSVLKVALNEVERPKIVLDMRGLPENYGRLHLYSRLAEALSRSDNRILRVLKRVRGISVLGVEVEITWKGRDMLALPDLFEALDEAGAIIAVDEAQNLRGPLSREFLEALAHAYDYCRNLTFILTGSEVGLLYDLLRIDDPSSPLYGRYYVEIRLERFSREDSIRFLERGFEEAGRNMPRQVIEEAVDLLDGIPGWLTFYGARCLRGKCDPREVLELAVNVARRELENLLRSRPDRYKYVLKAIAEGSSTWSEVKKYLEQAERKTISKSIMHRVLRNLEKMSIIREYSFLDPVYREAAKKLI